MNLQPGDGNLVSLQVSKHPHVKQRPKKTQTITSLVIIISNPNKLPGNRGEFHDS